MKDEIELGKLIEGEQQRDAIHVAISPVVASEMLYPGQDIGIVDGFSDRAGICETPIGIVDPFLRIRVIPDQPFWMFLYPQTITGMRHHWIHPAFDSVQVSDKPDKEASMKWMEEFASQHHYYPSYYTQDEAPVAYTAEQIVKHATDYLQTRVRHVQKGSESLRDYEDSSEFWMHYTAITGIAPSDIDREMTPFCCTC